MTWDGFIPDDIVVPCKKCGNNLETSDTGYPSRYWGIFNGFCYPCTSSGPFKIGTDFCGAERWSFPPELPSYRRNRSEHVFYTDCDDPGCFLKTGRHEYCKTCARRYGSHPIRAGEAKEKDILYKISVALWVVHGYNEEIRDKIKSEWERKTKEIEDKYKILREEAESCTTHA